MKIRISLVHYLNSAPLGWAFHHGPFREMFDVIPSSPAVCADQLAKGEVDIGLIPSIEYQLIPNLQVIPDISISSLREVRSILMIRLKEKRKLSSIAIDTSSRTSAALIKVFLQEKLGIMPEYIPCPPNLDLMLNRCDAALLIGDPALKVPINNYQVTDLAAEWVDWQKKPFVCAFWACSPDVASSSELSEIFLEAKVWGLNRRHEIAASYAQSLALPERFLEEYLTRNIDYDMGPEHVEGLQTFYSLANRQKLISAHRPLHFVNAKEPLRIESASARG